MNITFFQANNERILLFPCLLDYMSIISSLFHKNKKKIINIFYTGISRLLNIIIDTIINPIEYPTKIKLFIKT